MQNKMGISIIVAIQLACFALLWNQITTQQEYISLPISQATTPGASATTAVGVTRQAAESMLRDTIQTVLKQELAPYRQVATAPAEKQKTAATETVKENSPASIEAFNRATTVVNGAVAQGKWTIEDNMALSSTTQHLTDSQRRKILDEIGNAVNRQELKIDGPLPFL